MLKVKHNTIEDDVDFIKSVYETLDELYISKNFKLLCIVEEKSYFKDKLLSLKSLTDKFCFIETVKEFAPDPKTDTGGDIKGWLKIYKQHLFKYCLNFS